MLPDEHSLFLRRSYASARALLRLLSSSFGNVLRGKCLRSPRPPSSECEGKRELEKRLFLFFRLFFFHRSLFFEANSPSQIPLSFVLSKSWQMILISWFLKNKGRGYFFFFPNRERLWFFFVLNKFAKNCSILLWRYYNNSCLSSIHLDDFITRWASYRFKCTRLSCTTLLNAYCFERGRIAFPYFKRFKIIELFRRRNFSFKENSSYRWNIVVRILESSKKKKIVNWLAEMIFPSFSSQRIIPWNYGDFKKSPLIFFPSFDSMKIMFHDNVQIDKYLHQLISSQHSRLWHRWGYKLT